MGLDNICELVGLVKSLFQGQGLCQHFLNLLLQIWVRILNINA